MTTPDQLLLNLTGHRLSRVRQLVYEFEGKIRSTTGPVELTASNAGSLVLQPAGDGETLAVREGMWTNPFAPPLTPDNEQFVLRHGKWAGMDVSNSDTYRALIGRQINRVTLIHKSADEIVGVEMHLENGLIHIEVSCDELVTKVKT